MSQYRYLHHFAESARDAEFYRRICSRLSGLTFEGVEAHPSRLGATLPNSLEIPRRFLSRWKNTKERQDISVLIALDNDRAPGHPGGTVIPRRLPKSDLKKPSRYGNAHRMVNETLGKDRERWPVDVAIAIPVEMIESWLLVLLNPEMTDLPIFAQSSQACAKEYHGRRPPPQLKDLVNEERARRNEMSLDQLFLHAADTGDLDRLAESSPSFALFSEQVKRWRSE